MKLEIAELSQTFWSRSKGNNVTFTEDKENVGNGKPAGSVGKETSVVSSTIVTSVQNLRLSVLLLQNILNH